MRETNTKPSIIARDDGDLETMAEEEVWDALEQSGAVIFHNFDADEDRFYAFASRFNKKFLTSPFGDRTSINEENELQTVTHGQAGLDLHFEFGNNPMRPDLLWFLCRTPPAPGTGGETLIADGAAIFDRLPQKLKALLQQRMIKYTNYLPAALFEYFLKKSNTAQSPENDLFKAIADRKDVCVKHLNDGRVALEFIAPPVFDGPNGSPQICQNMFTNAYSKPDIESAKKGFSMKVTWENDEAIDESDIKKLRDCAKECIRGLKWKRGNFVLLDNNRTLHGRCPTSDPDRDLLLLCSYSKRYAAHPDAMT